MFVLVYLATALLFSVTPPQDAPSYEDALLWLPDINIFTLDYLDVAQVRRQEPLLGYSFAFLDYQNANPLKNVFPETWKPYFDWLLTAQYLEQSPEELQEQLESGDDETYIRLRSSGKLFSTVYIARIEQLPALLRGALSAGIVKESGKTIGKRPILAFSERSPGMQGNLLVDAGDNILLVSQNPAMLKRCLDTYSGKALGHLGTQKSKDYLGMLPNDACYWHLQNNDAERSSTQILNRTSGSTQEQLEKIQQILDEQPLLILNWFTFSGKEMLWFDASQYSSSELAQELFGLAAVPARYRNLSPEQRAYSERLRARTSGEQTGAWIVSKTAYDKELAEAQMKFEKALRDAREKEIAENGLRPGTQKSETKKKQ